MRGEIFERITDSLYFTNCQPSFIISVDMLHRKSETKI